MLSRNTDRGKGGTPPHVNIDRARRRPRLSAPQWNLFLLARSRFLGRADLAIAQAQPVDEHVEQPHGLTALISPGQSGRRYRTAGCCFSLGAWQVLTCSLAGN